MQLSYGQRSILESLPVEFRKALMEGGGEGRWIPPDGNSIHWTSLTLWSNPLDFYGSNTHEILSKGWTYAPCSEITWMKAACKIVPGWQWMIGHASSVIFLPNDPSQPSSNEDNPIDCVLRFLTLRADLLGHETTPS